MAVRAIPESERLIRREIALGLDPVSAGNVVAMALGLTPVATGWTSREIEALRFLRWLYLQAARGRWR